MSIEYGGRWSQGDYASTKINVEELSAITRGEINGEEVEFRNGAPIDDQIAELQHEVDLLDAQFQQFIAPSGEAPNPAEIENARVGADGVTYDTLGEAIRTQFTDVKSALFDTFSGSGYWKQGTPPSSWTNGSRITTKDYVNDSDFIGITLPTGWYGNLYAWDGDTYKGFYETGGTWNSSLDSSSYIRETTWFFKDVLEANPTYDFQFVARKLNGNSITPSDATGILLYKSRIDAVDARVDDAFAEISRIDGVNPIDFTFDGTLLSTDGKHSFSYIRPSIAYNDERTQLANNVPIYDSMKYFGQKGISMAPETTNLLSSADSQELSGSSTLSLAAGDYSVSLAEGEITVSGAAEGVAYPYKYLTFTLASSGSVTFTSTGDSNAKYVQVEELAYPTPWQIGGTERKRSTLVLNNASSLSFGEFGVGMIFRPNCNSNKYQNNEMYLLSGYKDADNYFNVRFVYMSATRKHFAVYLKKSGTVYSIEAPWNSDKPIYFDNTDVMGFYMHVIPSRGIYLYALKNGIVTPSISYDNVPTFGDVVSLAVGQRTINDGGRSSSDCTIANVRFDIDTKPDAMAYFKEVLEQ